MTETGISIILTASMSGTDFMLNSDVDLNARRMSAASKAAVRMMRLWGCGDTQAASLLEMDIEDWKQISLDRADLDLTPGQLKRLSYLLRIFNGLSVFSDGTAHAWPLLPNTGPLFQGKTPVQFMIDGGEAAMNEVAKMTESLGW